MTDDTGKSQWLRDATRLTEALRETLECERRLIAKRAPAESFEAVAADKLRLLDELETLHQASEKACHAAPETATERAKLQISLHELSRFNERNGIAIARVLGAVRDELAVLTGADRSAETYAPGGTHGAAAGRMHTRA